MELVYGKVAISDRDETILAIARTMDGIGRDGGYPCLTIPDNIPIGGSPSTQSLMSSSNNTII